MVKVWDIVFKVGAGIGIALGVLMLIVGVAVWGMILYEAANGPISIPLVLAGLGGLWLVWGIGREHA